MPFLKAHLDKLLNSTARPKREEIAMRLSQPQFHSQRELTPRAANSSQREIAPHGDGGNGNTSSSNANTNANSNSKSSALLRSSQNQNASLLGPANTSSSGGTHVRQSSHGDSRQDARKTRFKEQLNKIVSPGSLTERGLQNGFSAEQDLSARNQKSQDSHLGASGANLSQTQGRTFLQSIQNDVRLLEKPKPAQKIISSHRNFVNDSPYRVRYDNSSSSSNPYRFTLKDLMPFQSKHPRTHLQ